jgi:hypothetical protein
MAMLLTEMNFADRMQFEQFRYEQRHQCFQRLHGGFATFTPNYGSSITWFCIFPKYASSS